jgi:diguanylate cyclase (GGDEF)-like protein
VSNSTGGAGALAVLSAGAAALARAADLDTALGIILEACTAASSASAAAVFATGPEGSGLELLVTVGMTADEAAGFAEQIAGDSEHPVNLAALDRAGTLGRVAADPDGGSTTSVDLPLVVGSGGGIETCVGVLTLGWPGAHEVGTAEETLLVAAADLAAAALAAFRLSSMASEQADWSERTAHADALTGLPTELVARRVLDLELARAQRQGTEVSVAILDVDGFRDLNARAGARAGDVVLRRVAAVLAESVRVVDTIARSGADEFLLVAPGAAGGITIARRVRDGVAAMEPIGGAPISLSAGIALFPRDGADAESLISAARNALDSSDQHGSIAEVG